jgi:predicted nucleic acid-binding protein
MPTLDLTVEQVIALIKQLPLEKKKFVFDALKNELTEAEHPWLKIAGKYKDDSQFDKMLAYIEAERRDLDATIVVTRNRRDFEKVPKLQLKDWTIEK